MSEIRLVYPGDDKYKDGCKAYESTCEFNDADIRLAVYENGNGRAVYTYCDSRDLWDDGCLLCTWEALGIVDAIANGYTVQDEAIYDLLQKEAMELGFPSGLNSNILYGVNLMEGVEHEVFEWVNKNLPYSGEIIQAVCGSLDDNDWHEGNSPSYMFSCEEAALRWVGEWVMKRGVSDHVRLYRDDYVDGKVSGTGDTAMVYPPHAHGNCDDRWLYEGFMGRKHELHPDGTTSPWSYTWNMLVGNKLNDRIPYDVLEYLKSRGY